MAAADNVRTQYQDGLVLGAAQLSGDQTYVRAALERRSLSRDMFGIAWGLELQVETGSASSSTSAIVRVTPGVAYGGDGKAIVLRAKGEVSSLLKNSGAQAGTSWAIYINYTETAQSGQSGFSFCGQAMDPTVAEGTAFAAEILGSLLPDGERDGPQLEPDAALGGSSDPTTDRVLLGIVDFDAMTGQPSVRLVPGQVAIPAPTTPPSQADLAKAQAPPAQAEYIGVLAAGIAHPRAWAGAQGATITPAISLEPESGIHFWQKTMLQQDVYATGLLMVDGPVIANAGVAMVQPVDTTILTGSNPANSLVNLAVAYRTQGVVAADINTAAAPPIDDSARVLGIAIAPHDDQATQVRVVISGVAVATLTVDPSTLTPGQWLVLDSKGALKASGAAPTAGMLVAKFLGTVDSGAKTAKVLVSLG
jgi:hypothetical protein